MMHYSRLRSHGDPLALGNRLIGNNVTKHPLYATWDAMKQRCYNTNCSLYPYYGGRGITVCETWLGLNGFMQFSLDMGEKPSKKHSIDRVDNNSNYSKNNCRWATKFEQQSNLRSNNDVVGVSFNIEKQKWKAYIGSPPNRKHLGWFTKKEDATIARKKAELEY